VTQEQLPWWANMELRVDEADLRRLVEYMAEKAPVASASCGAREEAGQLRPEALAPVSRSQQPRRFGQVLRALGTPGYM